MNMKQTIIPALLALVWVAGQAKTYKAIKTPENDQGTVLRSFFPDRGTDLRKRSGSAERRDHFKED